jgi:hypothetical protein
MDIDCDHDVLPQDCGCDAEASSKTPAPICDILFIM